MSSWDQCCKGGKFNANFAKNQRTAETLKKVERPKENETSKFPEKISTWDQCCQSGKFNTNFVKTLRTAETLRKIERPEENETTIFSETSDEFHVSNAYTAETLRKIERPEENETSIFSETSEEFHVSNAYANKRHKNSTVVKNTTILENLFCFSDFGLNRYLLKWIESLGFSLPNRVQKEVLYHLSEGTSKHSVIKAPKKSGKTSAALLWVMNKLLCDKNKEYPKALMICPTFEIADTTYKFVEKVSYYCEIKIYPAMKGKKLNKGEQVTADLVIATPGKALELSNLKKAKYLIFDDAHCMSDAVGHLKTLSQVCSLLSSKCCIILCTSFCNKVLNDFIDECLLQNQRIEIENVLKKVLPKEIFIVYSNNEERLKAFIYLEKSNIYNGQTVVFCRTKDESKRLKGALDAENISVEILNGDLKPAKRNNIFQQFKENKIKLLITTYTYMEVLEAENVSKVINYEQVLNSEHKLDRDFYEQIENLLNGRKNCLIGSFIEQKWEDSLFLSKPGSMEEQVYANTTRISVNDLIAGQNFNK